ncbi:MAG: adenylate/guanylate cyclase domain-containing protein, partial [Acidimicrobiia bacterium]|nr:adenylate/guanylate cyclase domain-containing protein [Acidimicrobiia bacterium]
MTERPTGTVTFLFTDLERSTRLWEEQPESMQAALASHDGLLANAVTHHGGVVIKGTGDGVHAVFATADQAVAAAIAAQRAIGTEEWGSIGPLRVRMGLHTGVAEERGGDYYGPVLNRAARLMALAHGGQVLCSQATADLVRDSSAPTVQLIELGPHSLRDLDRPETVFQVAHPELPASFPRLPTVVMGAGNLPRQVTSFVGHDEELLAIPALLDDTALVTLSGVGGVGKTRLAIEIAGSTAHRFRDGAWLCELASVRDTEAVPSALLETFGVEARQGSSIDDTLGQFLASKDLLVVLDNCEHLLRPVAALVGTIVRDCPGVRVLATSREGLGLPGERILAVGSLELPDADDDIDEVAARDAVRLFVERAQAVRAGFAVDQTNAVAVAEVCRRLDGVPLAIELAAARVAMLTPTEIAERLDQRFRLLTGSERGTAERHQTLRAAIDWSYELLDASEQRVLDRLSVFVGSFSLDAAEAVTSGGVVDQADVFELLAGLVARSLVQADTAGSETRYRLLETVRQYAQEHLEDAGETDSMRAAHARWCAEFVEDLMADALTGERQPRSGEGAVEADNVRAALAWSIEVGNLDTLLRFFTFRGVALMPVELSFAVQHAAPRALEVPGVADDPRFPLVLGEAAFSAAQRGEFADMARYRAALEANQTPLDADAASYIEQQLTQVASAEGRIDLWVEHAKRAVALLRELPSGPDLATALGNLALGQTIADVELDEAVAEIDEALAIIEGDHYAARASFVLGNAAFVLADTQPQRAASLMRAALAAESSGAGQGLLHTMLADVAERLGEHRLALEYWLDGARFTAWAGLSEVLGRTLRRIALQLLEHDPETAAVLLGAGLERSVGSRLTGRAIDAQDRGIAELGEVLGAERFEQLMARGRSIDDQAAVALARTAATPLLTAEPSVETGSRRAPIRTDGAGQEAGNVFRRDGDAWVLSFADQTVQLRDAKGLRYLARLLSQPGREIHVSDLAGDGASEAGRSGPIDVVLDDAAARAYRDRIAELEADLAEAREWNDTERVARA